MARNIGLLDIHQAAEARPYRFEAKHNIADLISRQLARWIVSGVLAQLCEPPKVQNGMTLRGTFKSFQDLQPLTQDEGPLPSAELPGIKFVPPAGAKREYLQPALQF